MDMDRLDPLKLQANHRFQMNVQRRMYNHSIDVEIRPLDEDRAVKAALDFIGEAFIFSVTGCYYYLTLNTSPNL